MGLRGQAVPWAALGVGIFLFAVEATGMAALPGGPLVYLVLLVVTAAHAIHHGRGHSTPAVEPSVDATEQGGDPLGTLGTLTAGIAHELNNPLTYLEIDLKEAEELLAQDDLSPDRTRQRRAGQLIHEALEATETMRRTVRSLQVFARSRPVDEHASTSLAECVRSAVSLTQPELDRRADLEVVLGDCPPVAIAKTELTQVLVNLIRNAAARFDEHKRGRLRISGEVTEDMVHLTFSDDGLGMPPRVADHAFAPFVTLHPESAKALAGSDVGLRLAVCHGIVSAAGGRISLDSDPDGTTVRLKLPIASANADTGHSSPPSVSGAMTPRRYRLLLIDDDRRVARALKRALKPHQVVAFSGGEAAMAWLTEEDGRPASVDAVICDVMMPGLTGPDVHRRLDREHPELAARMIFITGGITSPEHRAFFAEHELPCLDKPVDLEALDRRIAAIAPPGGAPLPLARPQVSNGTRNSGGPEG